MAATQLAGDAGARVLGSGRAKSRDLVLELGAEEFVDLEQPAWEEAVGLVDRVFDAVGGTVLAARPPSSEREAPSSAYLPPADPCGPRTGWRCASSSSPTAV
ncbi:hypothetical protein SALBM217S_06097 [Streptomyces griseoloalbus]